MFSPYLDPSNGMGWNNMLNPMLYRSPYNSPFQSFLGANPLAQQYSGMNPMLNQQMGMNQGINQVGGQQSPWAANPMMSPYPKSGFVGFSQQMMQPMQMMRPISRFPGFFQQF